MDKHTRDKLSKAMVEYEKPGAGGRKFSYIKGEDVIGRLNTAFENDWNSCVVDSFMLGEEVRQVIVLVELKAAGIAHQGYGGAEVAVYTGGPKQGLPVDISNSYKGALTNAIKNAAKQFGIGLLTDETDVSDVPAPQPPVVRPQASTPVHASATISTAAKDKKVDEISKLLKTAVPEPTTSLAQGYKDKVQAETVKEEPAPFTPSVGDTGKVNDVQIGAMNAMSTMKSVLPDAAISQALGSTSKTEFKDLTTDEARKVIKHLHSTQGA